MKNIILFFSILLISASSYGQSQETSAQASTTTTSFAKSVGLYVFPAKYQSPQKQSQDDTECYKWAVQESKYDPLNRTKVEAQKVNTDPNGQA